MKKQIIESALGAQKALVVRLSRGPVRDSLYGQLVRGYAIVGNSRGVLDTIRWVRCSDARVNTLVAVTSALVDPGIAKFTWSKVMSSGLRERDRIHGGIICADRLQKGFDQLRIAVAQSPLGYLTRIYFHAELYRTTGDPIDLRAANNYLQKLPSGSYAQCETLLLLMAATGSLEYMNDFIYLFERVPKGKVRERLLDRLMLHAAGNDSEICRSAGDILRRDESLPDISENAPRFLACYAQLVGLDSAIQLAKRFSPFVEIKSLVSIASATGSRDCLTAARSMLLDQVGNSSLSDEQADCAIAAMAIATARLTGTATYAIPLVQEISQKPLAAGTLAQIAEAVDPLGTDYVCQLLRSRITQLPCMRELALCMGYLCAVTGNSSAENDHNAFEALLQSEGDPRGRVALNAIFLSGISGA